MITLCIDPGHGMSNRKAGVYDPGATAGQMQEASVALAYALAIRYIATQEYSKDIRVVLTREDAETPMPVSKRARVAEQAKADVFASLHLNAGGGTGSEVYVRDEEDKRLAGILAPKIAQAVGIRDRGVKSEGQSQHSKLAVLNFDGPACLIELGFIDTPKDITSLDKRETRIAVARAILEGIKEFYA